MPSIRQVLFRRTDLSTFLVHLTRDHADWPDGMQAAEECLKLIAQTRRIHALTPMGWADDEDDGTNASNQSQRVVCFSETPLEHITWLTADLQEERAVKLRPWGLAITKMVARKAGVNPVWYVDQTPGQKTQWEISKALDAMKKLAKESQAGFHSHDAAKVLPFFEVMGTWPTTGKQKEFWWEREWRKRGDFFFERKDIAFWIVPEAKHDEFTQYVEGLEHGVTVRCIDAEWGLEEILAHLADQHPTGPFS